MSQLVKLDLVGQKFGQWAVLREGVQRMRNRRWVCRCSCGTVKEVGQSNLRDGQTLSCGCTSAERISKLKTISLVGNQYGRLTVMSQSERKVRRQLYWHCICICGTPTEVSGGALKSGNTVSCGCAWSTHGMSGTKAYKRFHAMKRYCALLHRTPDWADLDAIADIYHNVPDGHDVDHVVPLLGRVVSGLHVAINLQYLPKVENCRKSNRFVPQFSTGTHQQMCDEVMMRIEQRETQP